MAKWCGKIGFAITVETEPGIWEESEPIERLYYGDSVRNLNRTFQNSGNINDDIKLVNGISIVADPFANENFCNMRYIEYMGTKWKISDIEVQYPRLVLTLGGVYNG